MLARSGGWLRILGLTMLSLSLAPAVLAQAPGHVWSRAFGSLTNDQGNAVATDASGNVYLTGSFTGTVSIGGQNLVCASNGCTFLAKLSPDGTPLWAKSFNNNYGYGSAVVTDANGNVFVGGVFTNADFGCGPLFGSIFAIKLAPDGSCVWSKPFKSVATAGAGNAGGNDALNGLAIDGSGDLFLAGKFGCSSNEGCAIDFGGGLITSLQQPSYGGIFLTKLSGTDGSHRWSKAYGGTWGQDYGAGVAVDDSGNAFMTGYFTSTSLNLGGSNLSNAGSSDAFLAKYRGSDGAHQWSKRFGGVSSDYGMAIAVDSGGAPVITGQFQGTADFGGIALTSASAFQPDIFLARFSSAAGATLWARGFGNTLPDSGRAIATDAAGHIEITGYFMGTVDFGTGSPLTSAGGLDVFLAQYSAADGSALWAKRFGGVSGDSGLGVDIDASGNTVIAGYFLGPVDFGGGLINGGGAYDIFVAEFGSPSGKTDTTTTLESSLNPSILGQTVIFTATVSPSAATGTVTFFDGAVTLGSGPLIGGTATLPIASLSVGSHSITATYNGDNNYNASTSSAVSQTVNADTTAPAVTLTAPAEGATVSGTYTMTATASDNVGVSRVEFFVDGVLKCTDTTSPYSCVWDTTTSPNGAHTASARAVDAAGNTASDSNNVTVSNTDTTPPAVTLTAPAEGATVSGTYTMTATASDNVGVSRVEFFVDGVLKCTDTTSPYSCVWDTTTSPNGAHTASARAVDAAGNTASDPNNVTVGNGDTAPPSVQFTNPANGATVQGHVTVSISATDNVGVTRTELYIDSVLKASSTNGALSYRWNTRKESAGLHSLAGRSYDAAGNVGNATISVTVTR
jgi:hypothetical protein